MTATLTAAPSSYRGGVAEESLQWPDVGHTLLDELSTARGRIALIAASTLAATDHLVECLRNDLRLNIVSLGRVLAASSQPPTSGAIEAACGDATVITDLELLFSPMLHVSVLPFLTNRSRHRATIAVWPGEITGGRALYSAPGRPDHHDAALRDAIVLRPLHTRFPDEAPFHIERIFP